jgi:hypothetical protein
VPSVDRERERVRIKCGGVNHLIQSERHLISKVARAQIGAAKPLPLLRVAFGFGVSCMEARGAAGRVVDGAAKQSTSATGEYVCTQTVMCRH